MLRIITRYIVIFVVALFGGTVLNTAAYSQQALSVVPQQISAVPVAPTQGMPAPVTGNAASSRPVLVISNSPVPKSILDKTYNFPTQVDDIQPAEIVGSAYYRPTQTMVSRKLVDLKSELAILQDKVVLLSQALSRMQRKNEKQAASYYAAVATINTQLQVGTTPGNPRLLQRYTTAESALENLAGRLADFNNLSIDASKVATEASFLLDSSRATFGLSGAIEEDHVQLAEIEDKINTMIVLIERVLNTVTDDISRTNSYLMTERDNLRMLSLAVANGSLYGMSLADRPFSGVRDIRQLAAEAPRGAMQQQVVYQQVVPYAPSHTYQQSVQRQSPMPAYEPAPVPEPLAESQPLVEEFAVVEEVEPIVAPATDPAPEAVQQRPLVRISFDRSDVDYEQPLYMAVNQVLDRYPAASFNIVAVHSSSGGAAANAIASTRSRRNAQKVVRTLSQIGVSGDKIGLSYDKSSDIAANEVHLYVF